MNADDHAARFTRTLPASRDDRAVQCILLSRMANDRIAFTGSPLSTEHVFDGDDPVCISDEHASREVTARLSGCLIPPAHTLRLRRDCIDQWQPVLFEHATFTCARLLLIQCVIVASERHAKVGQCGQIKTRWTQRLTSSAAEWITRFCLSG